MNLKISNILKNIIYIMILFGYCIILITNVNDHDRNVRF
jgi:hypothetical protein